MPRRNEKQPADIKIRMKEPLRRSIEKAAEINGHSMNSEMVSRLERSFAEEREFARLATSIFGSAEMLGLMKLVSAAMNEAGQTAGFYSTSSLTGAAGWTEIPYAYDQAMKACLKVLEAFRPKGEISIPDEVGKHGLQDLGKNYGNAIIAQMLGNETRTQFFTPERAVECKNDLGAMAVRLRELSPGENVSFTAHRDEKGQAIATMTKSGKEKRS